MLAADPKEARIAADFPILATTNSRGKRLVYLDSAASSQKPRAVIASLVDYYEHYNANIHRGVYEIAARATDAFEAARAKVARFVNAADTAEIIWTRNTTEAINLVSFSWGLANLGPGDAILTTQLEHHSNLVPWQLLAAKTGAQLRYIPADADGELVLDDLETLLDGVKLVALTHVSNTIGSIAPLDVIVPRAHAHGAVVLVDAAQSVPHMPVDVQALDVDFLAASGHKMCGPTGIGFLYGKRALLEAMPPFLTGGDMIKRVSYETTSFNELPWKFEAGTSNIADAIGLGAAVDYLSAIGMEWIRAHEIRLTAYALDALRGLEARGLHVYGTRDAARRGGVISFNFGDIHAHDLASILDTEGVCVRAGHHCTMPLMEKMGWPATARASFYLYTTEADVDALVRALDKAAGVFGLG
ncbi:cysteine desulfurase [Vulcanimicrobium alpinum]|uniref:Cysteine desulfurase n=1 Tax=Vulcanimicrobium alpinum TaxID=3016050 RepID=A0AAN1XWC9_UNVUL|nr:cysteine desulfurase [Vulcanimicrobium alpinum]BDE05736.1 cysteine desulfurase [Vulcanimicrobium alpinum]